MPDPKRVGRAAVDEREAFAAGRKVYMVDPQRQVGFTPRCRFCENPLVRKDMGKDYARRVVPGHWLLHARYRYGADCSRKGCPDKCGKRMVSVLDCMDQMTPAQYGYYRKEVVIVRGHAPWTAEAYDNAKMLHSLGVENTKISKGIRAANQARFDSILLALAGARQPTVQETVKVKVKAPHPDFGFYSPGGLSIANMLQSDWDNTEEPCHRLIQQGIPFRWLSQDRHYKTAKHLDTANGEFTSVTTSVSNCCNLILNSIYNRDETYKSNSQADAALVRSNQQFN